MTERSRRSFLKSATITGAVAGAALLPAGAADAAAIPQSRPEPGQGHEYEPLAGPAAAHPVVAYVKNAATGEIVVMSGEHEVVHKDPKLAARLTRLAAQAPAA
ncbi:twin-arginine translocation signal domain-containing protein [Actinospica robiniae]|uniref:twin-arginine translocation signal domain-containing protein n=1 Tax=Actinospica robiniae TaxID=304901 RepID=UPI00146FACC9|nr:twin-arginine translocation signal domain-containing protein [Actinospica robiniae]